MSVKTKVIDGGTHRAIIEAIRFAIAAGEDMVDGTTSASEKALKFLEERLPVWQAAMELLEDDSEQLPS